MGYATMGGAGGTQSIPNNTETLVALGTAGGAANKAGRATWNANGSVTLPLTGTYLVTGGVCWPSNANGERRCYIQKYAAGAWGFGGCAGGVQETNVAGTSYLRQQVTSQVYAAAGEQVGMRVFQGSGSALSLIAGADVARLGVHLLGAD
jgi:hypothetical protein